MSWHINEHLVQKYPHLSSEIIRNIVMDAKDDYLSAFLDNR
jgi:hypothetical protein